VVQKPLRPAVPVVLAVPIAISTSPWRPFLFDALCI
jgi:hypothetical protein